MTGELQGGWEYVIAAYAITWIFFGGYAASLWLRGAGLNTPEPGSDELFDHTRNNKP